MRKMFFAISFGALMLTSSAVFADQPVVNVSYRIHPNLAAAQKLSNQAYYKISAAQKANNNKMNGHAQRAKELLVEVNDELKLAAQAANEHNRR